jgi:hypothetical protein
LPYSRRPEHTSNAGPAKPRVGGPEPPGAHQIAAKRCKTKNSEHSREAGREAGRQPALLDAALWYAGRGYPVFPLHSVDDQDRCSCNGKSGCKPGKHPRIPNGHIGATTDPGQIRRWWSRWPDANIGIPTGKRSGLLVLDIDDHGFTSLDALEEEHGQLPETLTVRTGGGGMHVYLKYPAGCGIRNSAGRVGLGLDMRGEGGYIVAPPSRTDKGPYTFLDKFPRAAPPEWLLEAARAPHRTATDEDGANPGQPGGLDGEPIPKGERGDTLFRIACSLRAKGCEYGRILSEIRRINRDRCSPPIGAHPEDTDAKELEKIAESVVSRYPAGDASPEPPAEVLENVEALFAGVLERLKWTGRGGPTDRAVYAALLITARRYGQQVRGGVKVYISVRALAFSSGISKTTVLTALDRLETAKLVYRGSDGRGTKAGALVLKLPQGLTTQPRGGGTEDSGQPLRDVMRELLRLRWGPGRVGKTRALYLYEIARSGEATLTEISERTGRRRDNVRRALVMAEVRSLVECSGEIYRLGPEFRSALDDELEASGIKRAERLDRRKYERERQAYRERLIRRANGIPEVWSSMGRAEEPEPDGYIEDLEPVPDPETFQPPGKSAPVALAADKSVDAWITDSNDSGQFRELAHVLRTGMTRVEAQRERSSARREAHRLDRERGGYERHRDGVRISPAAFLRSELRGVSGMEYAAMLRRWKVLGGKRETLEGAISAGPYRLKREPMDFNRPYVVPSVSRAERGAA